MIDGKTVKKGKYAIFSIPSKKQWEIIFYSDTDNWNVPKELDKTKIVASIKVDSKQHQEQREVFTISIGDFTNYTFDLDIAWSNTSVSIPIDLSTREMMDKKINRVLTGPSYNDYYAAAEYQMEAGKDYEKGLKWINKAIEITDEVIWWDLRIKAIILTEMGHKKEARMIAEEGMKLAKKENRAYGINQFNIIFDKLDK